MKEVLEWLEKELSPVTSTSEEFIYNDMESQSGRSLPEIYKTFDPNNIDHWADRGSILDFLSAVMGKGKKLLDFGPGDGWPSLPVARYADEVVGLDSSPRRVQVCQENARKLGIKNAYFKYYAAGDLLPFPASSFDGVMAASSVEQTPDPKETLKEFYRVLRPGGRMRISYEALNDYSHGRENEVDIIDIGEDKCKIIIFDRRIEEELVMQYALDLKQSVRETTKIFTERKDFTPENLKKLADKIIKTSKCLTVHPSGETLLKWLAEIGFSEARMTHSGKRAAVQLFKILSSEERPTNLEGVDVLLEPTVQVVVGMEAPLASNSMITAVK